MNSTSNVLTWMCSMEQEARLFSRSSKAQIRVAAIADLKYLCNIEDAGSAVEPASLQQLTRWMRTSELGPRKRRGKSLWTAVRLVEIARRPVAHCILLGEDDCATLRMVVHPSYRGDGLGSMLLEDSLGAAQQAYGLALVECIVHERHESTLAFATHHGFKPREVQPVVRDWFGPGNDGYALQLRVAPPRM